MTRGRSLLASSATADGLAALVCRYVAATAGTPVELAPGGAVIVSGRTLSGVRWRVLRGRWRLETDDAEAVRTGDRVTVWGGRTRERAEQDAVAALADGEQLGAYVGAFRGGAHVWAVEGGQR